ncbi:ribbon-helix-helix domain-containing protein [Rhizobium sp. SL42]|uniref:ribbon-helix-helix domain-containing protein n=1 Tax=Rhizobium sp. SL42 TaxID=2806346 RepID=UPI001F397B65|nr:ribbon-helix-helix domain-containing protein [Rhizobium sp. SL42]UJW76598.1 ribbon-helix-helix protein, CopG family [Rhizobium sp. SL42]
MRTLVDIPETQIEALDKLAAQKQVSRADLIREAVGDLLDRQKDDAVRNGFGLWGNTEDGLSIQRRLRSEW